MSAKGSIDIRNVANISKDTKIRIEIERNGTLYRFDPFRTKVEKEKVEDDGLDPFRV
ncbi:hypothetical protein CKC_04230 [Candidatus Liberibacter solanacearum CLso-ZC1]|uniref:Uncharacterized protein n=1 Tax=Liberibacter solanacearum (strain CLso-ZC1) TaxID=658172 RepID=E4UBB6_LIBSC|nr:hypothetical protein [Candidatus Liberibacter solanacearum]ADR52595.1 hypothetical protein CKC_04230 [Candidatus Liberibacter solanacearum CLso-ZC1]